MIAVAGGIPRCISGCPSTVTFGWIALLQVGLLLDDRFC